MNRGDEANLTSRYHRMAALECLDLAGQARTGDGVVPGDMEEARYWQRDAQVHALLALSAGDDS